ncbi:ABC transporter permease subunit [Saliphagus infecundisoli]|uniref:ABC transporter permease subunit n=1 Tax=Saliphagus infecundisoli TaxID=1849069 RepID=A0ABD5QE43_9EURY|nr:ABC transporter permease subunit [Saliphagus infecundisoli]
MAVFVVLAVTISAITETSTRATVAAFGMYVVFTFRIWEQLPLVVAYIVRGFRWPESTPTGAAPFTALNPIRAFSNVLGGLPVGANGGMLPAPPAEPAFYERPAFAVVVLLGWIAATTAGGVYSFRASDL